ncbi:MAG: hypothetical protein AMJ81_11925 [Phycisphaerae bacterium SM23_33]|nr:MAG: hypothetical protein AMJ81_11925 [Phycisphaerae bacterium SM23_33]
MLRRAFGDKPPPADFEAWRKEHADALRALRSPGAAGPTFPWRLLVPLAAAAAAAAMIVLSVVLHRTTPPITGPQRPLPVAAPQPLAAWPTLSLYACGDVGFSVAGAFDLDGLNLSLPDGGWIVPAVTMSLDVPSFSVLPSEPERSLP